MNKNNLYFVFGIVFLFLVWFISSLLINNSGILPSIGEVFNELFVILGDSKTYILLGNTFLKILGGLLCSFLIALVLAILSLLSEKIEYFIRPFVVFLKSIPIVAVVMILIIMFFKQNVRFIGTIVASCFVMIPIIYESMLLGFKSVDPWLIKASKIDGKTTFQMIRKIHIPLAFPHVLSGLISSFGMGLKVMVMSEVIMNPNNSIGQLIGLYSSSGEITLVLAYSILLLIIVIIIDYILKYINKRINLIEK
jgi:NitT/TauT family transport system permease protein